MTKTRSNWTNLGFISLALALVLQTLNAPCIARPVTGHTVSERPFGRDTISRASNQQTIAKELREFGPDWASWTETYVREIGGIRASLDGRPKLEREIEGWDCWFFDRESIEYMVHPRAMDRHLVQLVGSISDSLARIGVDFLLVPIPDKTDLYPEKCAEGLTTSTFPVPSPHYRLICQELLNAGVELVDVLSAYREAKHRDDGDTASTFIPAYRFCTPKGVSIAAKVIAERVKRYQWYDSVAKDIYRASKGQVTKDGYLNGLRLGAAAKACLQPIYPTEVILNSTGGVNTPGRDAPVVVTGYSAGLYDCAVAQGSGIASQVSYLTSCATGLVLTLSDDPENAIDKARRLVVGTKSVRLVVLLVEIRNFMPEMVRK